MKRRVFFIAAAIVLLSALPAFCAQDGDTPSPDGSAEARLNDFSNNICGAVTSGMDSFVKLVSVEFVLRLTLTDEQQKLPDDDMKALVDEARKKLLAGYGSDEDKAASCKVLSADARTCAELFDTIGEKGLYGTRIDKDKAILVGDIMKVRDCALTSIETDGTDVVTMGVGSIGGVYRVIAVLDAPDVANPGDARDN